MTESYQWLSRHLQYVGSDRCARIGVLGPAQETEPTDNSLSGLRSADVSGQCSFHIQVGD